MDTVKPAGSLASIQLYKRCESAASARGTVGVIELLEEVFVAGATNAPAPTGGLNKHILVVCVLRNPQISSQRVKRVSDYML